VSRDRWVILGARAVAGKPVGRRDRLAAGVLATTHVLGGASRVAA
jgi:hypothetical protein